MSTPRATPHPLAGHVVGENVQRIREARGWTQSEAAEHLQAIGLPWQRSHLAALEAGGRESANISVLALIAEAFGVQVAELFAGDGHVQLTSDTVVTRAWLRDMFASREPNDSMELSGRAVQALLDQMPGERVSFQADADLAQRLGLRPEDVYVTAERLWGRNLHQERDRRIAAMGEMSASERRARRGHVTRQLAKEIEPHLPNRKGRRR